MAINEIDSTPTGGGPDSELGISRNNLISLRLSDAEFEALLKVALHERLCHEEVLRCALRTRAVELGLWRPDLREAAAYYAPGPLVWRGEPGCG